MWNFMKDESSSFLISSTPVLSASLSVLQLSVLFYKLVFVSRRSRALGIYQPLSQNSQNSGDFWCLDEVHAQSVSWSTTEQGEQVAFSQTVLLLCLPNCLMAGSREMDLEGSCPKDILVKNNFSFPTQQQTMFYVLPGCWGPDLCLWVATLS